MIFGIGFSVLNVGNDIQISISENTKAGQRIKRESAEEYIQDMTGNFLIRQHPEHKFLIGANANYALFAGGVKIKYTWDENSPEFKDEHLQTYLDIMDDNAKTFEKDFDKNNLTYGPGFVQHKIYHDYRLGNWHTPPLVWEPYCTTAEVEILLDDSVLLCPMQHYSGWKYEHVDIMPGKTIESSRPAQKTYIVFGQRCTVQGEDSPEITHVEKHTTKQQTSSNLKITNESPNIATLVRISK